MGNAAAAGLHNSLASEEYWVVHKFCREKNVKIYQEGLVMSVCLPNNDMNDKFFSCEKHSSRPDC